MIVTFEPTGQSMNTDLTVFNKGPQGDSGEPVVIGNDGWGGAITSGSLQAQVGGSNYHYISWKDHGVESTRALWPMDDATAVETGLTTITTALNADTAAITLKSDGSLGS